jgi:hypothetical protein
MKAIYFIPLIFLSACSTPPTLTLRPQSPPPPATDSLRYPELVRAYHFGRYVDPNDGLVMHEQHVVYRVEENTRWNLHPGATATLSPAFSGPRDAAFVPAPVNDDVLAEVNAQKLATVQIMSESKVLASALQQLKSALRASRRNQQTAAELQTTMNNLKVRLDALETATPRPASSPFSTTNEPPSALGP